MSALYTALREAGIDDALNYLAVVQAERDDARQRVAFLENRVQELLEANNRELERRRAGDQLMETVNSKLQARVKVLENRVQELLKIEQGEWRLVWMGSLDRGDHIIQVDRFGNHVREVAHLGDQHHDAAGTIVRAHNEALVAARSEGADGWHATHQHRAGGLYRVIARGVMEADLSPVVVYDDREGRVWVRPASEFDDGRFSVLEGLLT